MSGRQLLGVVRERRAGALPHANPGLDPTLAQPSAAAAASDRKAAGSGGIPALQFAHGGEREAGGMSTGASEMRRYRQSGPAGSSVCVHEQQPGNPGGLKRGIWPECAEARGAQGPGRDPGIQGKSPDRDQSPGRENPSWDPGCEAPTVLELQVGDRVTAVGVRRWAAAPPPAKGLGLASALGVHTPAPSRGAAPGQGSQQWEDRTAFYDGAGRLVAEEAGGWLWRAKTGVAARCAKSGAATAGASSGAAASGAGAGAGAAAHALVRTATPLVRHISFLARDGAPALATGVDQTHFCRSR